MHITEALIERFLAGRCSSEEAASVSRYLRDHPEAWKKYMIDSWNEETAAIPGTGELPSGYRDSMLQEIRSKIFRSQPEVRGRSFGIYRKWAVAAAVLLVIAGAWFYGADRQARERAALVPSDRVAIRNENKEISSPVEWQLNANRTDQKLKMKLEDGSVVTLLPHSSIRYEKHFADNPRHTRDVFLQGQAFFEAARDKGRPFTVFAGNMATTVLGTSFSVHENETGVLVKLYSGKVVVHAMEKKNLKDWKKEIFLSPGQQLRYETGGELATVSHFETRPSTVKAGRNTGADSEDLVFDNTALPEVMKKLIGHYHEPIDYKETELSGMYFSGSVLKTDSLSVILKVIGNMNGLQITQTTDGFLVHPSKN